MISRQTLAIFVATMLGMVGSALAVEPTQSALATQATISRADAEKIALAKVRAGTVESAELEQKRGALVWLIDISRPDAADIYEIVVDAKTGKILRMGTATPTAQKKEAAAEKPVVDQH